MRQRVSADDPDILPLRRRRGQAVGQRSRRDRQVEFLEALRELGTVYHACRAAHIGRQTVYEWREGDPDFATAWDRALESNTEILEQSLFQKAVNPQGGMPSIVATMFLLRGRRPQMYRENPPKEAEHQGPIRIEFTLPMSDGQRELPTQPTVIDGEVRALLTPMPQTGRPGPGPEASSAGGDAGSGDPLDFEDEL